MEGATRFSFEAFTVCVAEDVSVKKERAHSWDVNTHGRLPTPSRQELGGGRLLILKEGMWYEVWCTLIKGMGTTIFGCVLYINVCVLLLGPFRSLFFS